MDIEHSDLDLARCSNAYSGGNRKFNPFWDPRSDLPEEEFMNEYLSRKLYDGPIKHLTHVRNNPAIEGARGCMRACMIHLESQGKLKNTFKKPFRRRKEWMLD
jgi:hypothetical protein